jgi:hypothetical protein
LCDYLRHHAASLGPFNTTGSQRVAIQNDPNEARNEAGVGLAGRAGPAAQLCVRQFGPTGPKLSTHSPGEAS